MSLEQINHAPKVAKYLADHNTLGDQPFVLLDIGAREGCERQWQAFGNQIFKVGVEPDAVECQRLNARNAPNEKFLPVALWSSDTEVPFYIAATAPSCSMYPANEPLLGRFLDLENVRTVRTTTLKTTTVDGLTLPVDFFKMDAEGAELEILKGAEGTLQGSALGLCLEVMFQSWRQGAPTFDQVHAFCTSRGFRLYDLASYRHVRKNYNLKTYQNYSSGFSPLGQMIWGEALYLRDAVEEITSGSRPGWWTPHRIYKMVALYEMHYLHDCAFELLEICAQRGLLPLPVAQELARLLEIKREELACFVALNQAAQRKRFGSVLTVLDQAV